MVFSIWGKVNAISLAGNICDSFLMSHKYTNWLIERSTIPNLNKAVVWARKEQIRSISISPAYWIDLITMRLDYLRYFVLHKIVNQDLTSFGSTRNFSAISREFNWHYCGSSEPKHVSSTTILEIKALMFPLHGSQINQVNIRRHWTINQILLFSINVHICYGPP